MLLCGVQRVRQSAPPLPVSLAALIVGPEQYGSIAGGGVDFPVFIIRNFLASARAINHPTAALFVDVRRAFYSCTNGTPLQTDKNENRQNTKTNVFHTFNTTPNKYSKCTKNMFLVLG